MYVYVCVYLHIHGGMHSPSRIRVCAYALVEDFVVVTLLYGIGINSRIGGACFAAAVDI